MTQISYGNAVRRFAAEDPDADTIVFEDRVLSRQALDRRSNQLARVFHDRGVRSGDFVTIALPNSIEFFEASLAAWKLGATPQPISYRLPEIERRAIIELAKPALIIGMESALYPEFACLPVGFELNEDVDASPLPDRIAEHVRAMTSGGSTGRPKLIVDTSPALCDPDQGGNDMQSTGATLVPGPLYHSGPFITAWQQLLCGGRVILMRHFDETAALALIEKYRVDWVLFVPTMMHRIWRLDPMVRQKFNLESLRVVMSAGAPCPVWLKREWIEWLGPERIHEAYGGSERIAGTAISGTEWLEHPGSVGKPTLDRKLRILDEAGQECPPNQVGEVYMMPPSGPGSTYRYIGAEPTSTEDGWETLGDMGYVDDDGYLYLVDRKTDMILVGGANVYPAEVEAALEQHHAVQSSAVIGLPSDDFGQVVHAIVQTSETINEYELREHIASRLVSYKVPRSFEFVDEPLRDDAGKVRRSALREARLR